MSQVPEPRIAGVPRSRRVLADAPIIRSPSPAAIEHRQEPAPGPDASSSLGADAIVPSGFDRVIKTWQTDHAGAGAQVIAFVVRARSPLARIEQAPAPPHAG